PPPRGLHARRGQRLEADLAPLAPAAGWGAGADDGAARGVRDLALEVEAADGERRGDRLHALGVRDPVRLARREAQVGREEAVGLEVLTGVTEGIEGDPG